MPAYNAASTIERAVASVMNQTVASECVLTIVDDGSTDSTPDVIIALLESNPEWAPRCRVVTLPCNMGVANAYNAGLKEGQLPWIARCDADDEMMPDAIERMLEAAERVGADIVAGNVEQVGDGTQTMLTPKLTDGLNRAPIDTVNFTLWNKLIRRTLLLGAPDGKPLSELPGVNCWDDLSLTARLLALQGCKVMSLPGAPVYRYYLSSSRPSLSQSTREYQLSQRIMCVAELERWFESNCLAATYKPFIDRLKFKAKINMLRGPGALGRIKEWRATFPEIAPAIMSMSPDMSLPLRVAFRILSI